MKTLIKSLMVILLAVSTSVFASPLSDAKKAGFIGEQYTGYLGIVKDAPPTVKSLVKEINEKRKSRYQQIAAKRKTSLKSVEAVAGASAIKKTAPGNYIKLKGQGWKKK